MDNRHREPGKDAASHDWSERLGLHARWLRTVIAARSREVSAIDEIFQEVALAAIKHETQIPQDRVAPWLYRVAVRQAVLYRRRMGRQRKLRNSLSLRHSVDSDVELDPLTWLLSDERKQLIRRALEKLNSKDAELLLLKYTEDWSYHELADHLGVSHSAVETRLHRARQRLRSELVTLEVVEAES